MKVYEGIFNPQNIAGHNARRFINYMSGNVGWLPVALLGNQSQNQKQPSLYKSKEDLSHPTQVV